MKDWGSYFGGVARLSALLCAVLPLQSCALAAYGLGVATMANDSAGRHADEYASYVKRVGVENVQRSEAGLPVQKILSRRAWSKQKAVP